jgi:hypothetical protein
VTKCTLIAAEPGSALPYLPQLTFAGGGTANESRESALTNTRTALLYRFSLNRFRRRSSPVHLPIIAQHARDLTSDLARSAQPLAPVRSGAVGPAVQRRSPGVVRRAVASALRWSADRLAPVGGSKVGVIE